MAWCCQATSHYLNQCWPRSPTPYGVTRPQRVKVMMTSQFQIQIHKSGLMGLILLIFFRVFSCNTGLIIWSTPELLKVSWRIWVNSAAGKPHHKRTRCKHSDHNSWLGCSVNKNIERHTLHIPLFQDLTLNNGKWCLVPSWLMATADAKWFPSCSSDQC